MGGGAEDDRSRDFLRQSAQETGFAAAADDDGDSGLHAQLLVKCHGAPPPFCDQYMGCRPVCPEGAGLAGAAGDVVQ